MRCGRGAGTRGDSAESLNFAAVCAALATAAKHLERSEPALRCLRAIASGEGRLWRVAECALQGALTHACSAGDATGAQLLLAGADPSTDDSACLRRASESGHADVVELLLADRCADPSACESECLREASRNGHANVVELLLADQRADPSAFESACLREASRNGHAEIVNQLLLDQRADPTANDSDATACAWRQKMVTLLLSHCFFFLNF